MAPSRNIVIKSQSREWGILGNDTSWGDPKTVIKNVPHTGKKKHTKILHIKIGKKKKNLFQKNKNEELSSVTAHLKKI